MQEFTRSAQVAGAMTAALLMFSMSGCSGVAVEGTYFGTAGDTVLVLEPSGHCRYTDEYSAAEGVLVQADDECSWSISRSTLTLIGVSRHGSLTGQIGDHGDISIPDQHKWHGEIYTKN